MRRKSRVHQLVKEDRAGNTGKCKLEIRQSRQEDSHCKQNKIVLDFLWLIQCLKMIGG
jgi:hypothetical protein